jgi:hypothetical protein
MAAAKPTDIPPSNITLTPKVYKKFRPLLLDHAIVGDTKDTILSRVLCNFFELLGEPVWGEKWTQGMGMTRAEDVFYGMVRIKEPRGLVFTKDASGIGGTIRSEHIENTVGFPKQITDRLVEATRRAFVSAATDDPSIREVILYIKNPSLEKPTKVWYRFPTEVTTIDELKGFRNIFYTTYYTPVEEGKKRHQISIKGRRNIINEAIEGAYTDLSEPTDEPVDEDESAPRTPPVARPEDPASVFINELPSSIGFTVADDGSLANAGAVARPSLLTVAYQMERGPLLSLFPDMILPGEVDIPVVVMAEKLGKLISESQDRPDQGDIEVIRTELKALDPTKGKSGVLLKNLDKVTEYFLVSRPFKPYARTTYLYASHTSVTAGHPMKALRTVRVK